MKYKHTHKVGIKKFQSNMYQHLEKIDKDTDLLITNSGQAAYSVSIAAVDSPTPEPDQTTVSSTMDTIKEKELKKHEDDS